MIYCDIEFAFHLKHYRINNNKLQNTKIPINTLENQI